MPDTASLEEILNIAAEAFDQPEEKVQEAGEQVAPVEQKLTREKLLKQTAADRTTLVETYIKHQVARVLGLNPALLDMQQPFDTLGLDSLMAIELKNRIEVDLAVALPVVNFLSGPSATTIAELVLNFVSEQPATALVPIVRTTTPEDEYPLSYGQQAMWFLHQLIPEGVSFNVAGAIRL